MKKIKMAIKSIFDVKKFYKAINLLKMLYMGRDTKYPKEVLSLEKRFAKYIGTEYALSFCNGTTSFDSAVFALGLEDGDEVLICGMSFQSVVLTLLQNRLNIQYMDMDENLNVLIDESKISKKTKLLVVSHLFGYPQNMKRLLEIKDKYNLKIIEDCSHAHGAEYNGSKVGKFGDISFFSFQGDKAVSGGEAGFTVTDEKIYYDRMRLYAHMGRDMTDIDIPTIFNGRGFGRKGRMHPFASALASIDLNYLDSNNNKIISSIKKLDEILSNFSFVSTIQKNTDSTLGGFHHGYPIWITDEDIIIKLLSDYSNIFRKYPYQMYHKYDILYNGVEYHKYIKLLEKKELVENNINLNMIEKAEKNLIFIDIKIIEEMDKNINKLKNILESYK